jgi:hypothetical protein
MANHAFYRLLVSLAVGCAAAPLAAQPKATDRPAKAPVAADFDRLAQVFAPPGTPSVKDRKWVTIDVGPTNASATRTGWLVKDGPTELSLLDGDGDLLQVRKPGPGEKRPTLPTNKDGSIPFGRYREADRSVAWAVRPDDFAAAAKKFLATGVPEYKEGGPFRDMSRGRFALQAHVVDAARLAHFARQAGAAELADKLYAHAAEAYATYQGRYGGGFEKKGELHEFVADRVASSERNGAMWAAHNGAPRADLLKRWERVAAVPDHQYRDEAKEMVEAYRTLIAEDAKWAEPDAEEWAAMTPAQQAEYWVHHLRDLAVGQSLDPGSYSVFGEFGSLGADDRDRPNPAVELKKLGMAAVPHLIAHLDDPRPTRCKGHWRSYWPDGHYLLRYGDCCQQVFEAITGHTLTGETYPMQAKKGKECKAAAEKWWREYRVKGEKQVLIEGAAAGTRDSPGHAEKLAAMYPDAALGAIRTGARACRDPWARAGLVRAAAGLPGEAVTAFLREEADGPFPGARVRAATGLAARGDPAGAGGLLREWDRLSTEKNDDWLDRRFVADELIGGILGTNDPAAVRGRAAGLTAKPADVRSTLIRQLGEADKDLRGRPLTRETANAVDDVLAGLLADREAESSASSRNGRPVRDPMLGDLAAEALAGRLGDPRLFDIAGPLQGREWQRVEVKNAWLRKRGKDPVPVPAKRTIEPAPDAKVQPLVRAVADGKTADRRTAITAIERLGLPALPAVRKAVDGLAGDHPARAPLLDLATRLSLVVAEVRFSDDSAKPADAVRRRVEELRDKPVAADVFLGLLRDLSGNLPAGTRGVRLTLERVGDDTGVLLLVTLVADCPARPGLAPQLSYGSRVVIRDETFGGGLRASAGLGGQKLSLAGIDWTDFGDHLRTGLRAPAGEYLFAHVHCAEER